MQEFLESVDHHALPDSVQVHPTAVISKGASFGVGVKVGPLAVIGPNAVLNDHVCVGAAAIVSGHTQVGAKTQIHSYATVGATPQDLKYAGEPTKLLIGERNTIREYVNIAVGTIGGNGQTVIGDDNLLMSYTHVAHDGIIGDNCIFANAVQIAGHVEIGSRVVFGGMAGAHQFCKFGDLAMIGAGSVVVQDVPPYCMVQGDRAAPVGLNLVGLRRAGVSQTDIAILKKIFRAVFKRNMPLTEATVWIETNIEKSPHRDAFLEFLRVSKRGLCR